MSHPHARAYIRRFAQKKLPALDDVSAPPKPPLSARVENKGKRGASAQCAAAVLILVAAVGVTTLLFPTVTATDDMLAVRHALRQAASRPALGLGAGPRASLHYRATMHAIQQATDGPSIRVHGAGRLNGVLGRRRHLDMSLLRSPDLLARFGARGLCKSVVLANDAQRRPVQSEDEVDGSTEQIRRPVGAPALGQYEPQKLSEDILTIPNVLTVLRLASTPVLGWLVISDQMPYALGLLAVSGFTDLLDGYLARKYKSATVFGSIADPAADKALMTVMVGALAWRGLIPIPLVVLIIGRDVALVLSAFLIRWQSLPSPKTLSRYWDPRLPSAKVEPTQVSKYNTFLQIILVGLCTLLATLDDRWRLWWSERRGLWQDDALAPAEGSQQQTEQAESDRRADADGSGDHAKKAWHAFMLLVATTTVWSGASYLFGTGAVRYVGRVAKARSSGNSNASSVMAKQAKKETR